MCLNYRFFLLMLPFLLALILSVILGCYLPIDGIWLSLFLCLFSILVLLNICCNEPVFYVIDKNGITVACVFKRYLINWRDIKHIQQYSDARFKHLFIKDYVLHLKNARGIPHRCMCIMKYTKTTTLIKRYGLAKWGLE